MTEEEKEVILTLDTLALNGLSIPTTEDVQKDFKTTLNLIQKQQEEIEKKDKIIDLMLGHIDPFRLPIEEKNIKSAKQYFERKAEEV